MAGPYVLLRCIAKAAVKNIVNLVTFGVGGDILVDAWEYWQKETREEQRAVEVQAAAQLSASELRAEVARIVHEEAAALPAEQQAQVASYLAQVPATIRRSLRRPTDPTGTTLAAGTVFRSAEDLLPLLPPALPRFKAGDRPPGIGDWELVELLGVGGFGEVWKARNPRFDGLAPVALKFCLDPKARERLLTHEAKIVNQVMSQGKHEGIVPLLHTYLSADPPCLAYEYIDGGDLAGLIQSRRGGLPPQQAARVVQRLAEIVGFAHRLSPPVVHRDLKPANILMKSRTQGKLALRITDFGIGGLAVQQAVSQSRRSTNSGEFLTAAVRGAYTLLYASPQQMRGEEADTRDDVYALGVIWYQMLTGDLTKGRPGGEAWRKRLADRGMTPALLALLASTYEDERADRPANGAELAEKIAGQLRELSAVSAPPILEAIPVESHRPTPLPDSEQKALDADWQRYEECDWEDEFLRRHAPVRLGAWRAAAERGNPKGQMLLGGCLLEGIEVKKDEEGAAKWFKKAAEQSLPVGQVCLGGMYLVGRGVEQSDAEAVMWIRKAATQGEALGESSLGTMYKLGRGVPQDDAEAFKWFRKAAEQGHADAQDSLGGMYAEGRGVAKNDAEAVKWYRKAAVQGNKHGQFNLGYMYYEGRSLPQDRAEAVEWFQKAAEQGHLPAQAMLGVAQTMLGLEHDTGEGGQQDNTAAVALLRQAAEQGDADAQGSLGHMYQNGVGVTKNDAEAFKWFRKAAEQGHADAQDSLGGMYAEGRGVAKNDAEAVKWYRKAAVQGNKHGQFNLGYMYYEGRSLPQDRAEAVEWFQKAAEQGHLPAQAMLGVAQTMLGLEYYTGEGGQQDYEEAAKWLRKAAEQGDASAQSLLGGMYAIGQGVPQDHAKAVKWYRKAAEQGNATGQCSLASAYERGQGVVKNDAEAAEWYRKAAEQGHADAKKALKRLSPSFWRRIIGI